MQEMQETRVQSLGQEDPLEKKMATHFSILAWENSMDRGAWQATVHRAIRSQTRLSDWAHISQTSHYSPYPRREELDCISFLFRIYLATWGVSWAHRIFIAASGMFSCSMRTLSCGMWDLVPSPGTEPGSPALAVWSLNHWTAREVSYFTFWYEEQYASIGRDRVTSSHLGDHPLQPSPHLSYHNSCVFDGIGLKSRIS